MVCPLPLEILVDIVLELLVIELEELLCWNIAIELVIIGTTFFYMCFKILFGCNFDFGIQLLDEYVSIQDIGSVNHHAQQRWSFFKTFHFLEDQFHQFALLLPL